MRIRQPLMLIGLALALAGPVTRGDVVRQAAPADLSPEMQQLLTRLDSAAIDEREAAIDAIVTSQKLTPSAIDALLSDKQLTPEQFVRLWQLGLAVFVNSPRGALGVQFDGDTLRVNSMIAGFPAAGVLQPDDVIVEVDGVAVPAREVMFNRGVNLIRPLIISRDAGDIANLQVIRRGQPVMLSVKLGNFADLDDGRGRGGGFGGGVIFNEISDETFVAAWRQRVARVRPDMAQQGLKIEEPADGWYASDGTSGEDAALRHHESALRGARPGLVIGGVGGRVSAEVDSGFGRGRRGMGGWWDGRGVQRREIVVQPRGAAVGLQGGLGQGPMGGNVIVAPGAADMARMQALSLVDLARSLQSQVAADRAELANKNLTPVERRVVQTRIDAGVSILTTVRQQAEALVPGITKQLDVPKPLADPGLAPAPRP
ncbi:MAG: PDZ domain-containing protein [Phycisphaerales bacterium]|nr:PDZ domain-containing protein [Phycisphaerales bacterium]